MLLYTVQTHNGMREPLPQGAYSLNRPGWEGGRLETGRENGFPKVTQQALTDTHTHTHIGHEQSEHQGSGRCSSLLDGKESYKISDLRE